MRQAGWTGLMRDDVRIPIRFSFGDRANRQTISYPGKTFPERGRASSSGGLTSTRPVHRGSPKRPSGRFGEPRWRGFFDGDDHERQT